MPRVPQPFGPILRGLGSALVPLGLQFAASQIGGIFMDKLLIHYQALTRVYLTLA